MKINKKFIYAILTTIWTLIIFLFSLQNATESVATSDRVGQAIINHSPAIVTERIEKMPLWGIDSFDSRLRTCAHFVEFFMLGVLMYCTMCQTKVSRKALCSILLCMLVAFVDESIQLFSDGRAMQFSDWFIDCCGSFVGILLNRVIKNLPTLCEE